MTTITEIPAAEPETHTVTITDYVVECDGQYATSFHVSQLADAKEYAAALTASGHVGRVFRDVSTTTTLRTAL